jgi:AraC-like DNA-binding protein
MPLTWFREADVYEVPAVWVRHVADRLGDESTVVRGAMRHAGLSMRLLGDGSEAVRCTAFVAFLEQAALLAADDLLGFSLGMSYDLRASGLAGYVAIAAATVREAMANTVRYGALRDTSAVYALEDGDGVVRFRMDSRSAHMRGSRQATEFKAALVLAACHRWIGPGFRPLEARFAHPRASGQRAIERHFNCPVRFAAEATEMVMSPEQMDLPVRGADPHLLALVTRHAEAALAATAAARHGDLRARVERAVLDALTKGAPTLGAVAGALGVGERTLARRLSADGTSFRQVVDELRRDLAKGYLADPELSLSQIAYLLGYAEQSAFTNAFRRWTGWPPRRFRVERPDV